MVHYIRFLRTPQCDVSKKTVDVSAVVAVQTDLSDALLSQDLVLNAEIVEVNSPWRVLHSQSLQWQAISRALKFAIPCPGKYTSWPVRLHVATQETQSAVNLAEIPEVLDIWSCDFLLSDKQRSEPIVERRLLLWNNTTVRIWEDVGESMARHIWDASLGFVMYLARALSSSPPSGVATLAALVKSSKVRKLQVLELGAGCGIVGISFAQLVKCDMYLTDLEDAQAVLAKNIRCASLLAGSTLQADVLDWASGLEDSSNPNFDLILVSDCIYNPDSSVHLVEVLRQLAACAPNTLIVVGFKRRHEADAVFFEHMRKTKFEIVESTHIPLPHRPTVYDADTPTTEFYLYRHRGCSDPQR
ncbi:hypothetical protein G647_10054 [Cladophialophora carrionii CBS 160.54]|uniref:Methyltransferase small domain-containing protein n=1 Tax=Cladophialophora carrionii CBS 160.54 TaxID=1279043 RepID=V9DJC7_9EURO|nr:uncharacterized protein G647_10054 [Cladophialophora carrionii CBS 160.54]ETI26955.1 hypothetical protein G647_10054 [Cladophialophora carrionii CBS 160.54]